MKEAVPCSCRVCWARAGAASQRAQAESWKDIPALASPHLNIALELDALVYLWGNVCETEKEQELERLTAPGL